MIQPDRVQDLNDKPVRGDARFVLYWMQQAQRVDYNHALSFAISEANQLGLPVLVCFGLMADYPEANKRHFAFMLEGLAETSDALAGLGIKLIVELGSPDTVALECARNAALVVCDRGYLRHQRAWRRNLGDNAPCRAVQVETDVVVPVDTVSRKAEYAARTIRRKINSRRDLYLEGFKLPKPSKSSLRLRITSGIDLADWRAVLDGLDVDGSVASASRFTPGARAARRRLEAFVADHLPGYADARNDPANPSCSQMSPYLHFGQISPVEIAVACRAAGHANPDDRESFLEELIVRRELAINFVNFTEDYDSYACLPEWARKTLAEHGDDARPHIYDIDTLASAATHDPAWNAAMTEMTRTGYMHNYMRMYWGKKIIEWSKTPEAAFETTLALNNRYFIDGRDPNSYAGVAWLFGVHDRAWQERRVFGKIRYMNAAGLRRKFDIDAYISWSKTL